MALNQAKLTDDIKTTFQTAKDQGWSIDQVAAALASAIDAYVRGGDVTQVTVTVTDKNNTVIGTGTQTGTGKIQ